MVEITMSVIRTQHAWMVLAPMHAPVMMDILEMDSVAQVSCALHSKLMDMGYFD